MRQNYKPPPKQPLSDAGGTAAGASEESGGVVGGSIAEDLTDAWLHDCVAAEGGAGLLDRVRRKAHRKRTLWQSEVSTAQVYAAPADAL